MNLGKKLQQFRKSRGLTLKELSSITNLSISFLSDIEHNRSHPSINNLKLLSEVLNIPISQFLEDKSYLGNLIAITLSDILPLIDDFSSWNECDKLELYYYLKAKKIIRENKE